MRRSLKKMLSLFLALSMVLSLTVTMAWAETVEDSAGPVVSDEGENLSEDYGQEGLQEDESYGDEEISEDNTEDENQGEAGPGTGENPDVDEDEDSGAAGTEISAEEDKEAVSSPDTGSAVEENEEAAGGQDTGSAAGEDEEASDKTAGEETSSEGLLPEEAGGEVISEEAAEEADAEDALMSVDSGAYSDLLVTTENNKNKSGEDLEALAVTFNNTSWYIIEDNSTARNAGTVTLLAKDPIAVSEFDSQGSNKYSSSKVKKVLEDCTKDDGSFVSVEDAIIPVKVKGSPSDSEVEAKLWLLSYGEAKSLSEEVRICSMPSDAVGNAWWLRTAGTTSSQAAWVNSEVGAIYMAGFDVDKRFGVRPALTLDLTMVTYNSKVFTFVPHTHGSGAEAITFKAWRKTDSLPDSGSWFLKDDVTVTDETVIPNNKELKLCLNGKSISFSNSETDKAVYSMLSNGTLSIYDESENEGSITSSTKYCINGMRSTVNLYGGTLETTDGSPNEAETIYVYSGTVVLDGAAIKGRTGIKAYNTKVTVEKGTIDAAAAAINNLSSSGTKSGEIKGGTFKVGENGTLFPSDSGFMQISGGLFTGSLSGESQGQGPATVTLSGGYYNPKPTIRDSENPNCNVKVKPGFELAESSKIEGYTHTIRSHTHDQDSIVFDKIWDSTSGKPEEAGNYVLAEDVVLNETWKVPSGTVNLCLDGHSITMTANSKSVIEVSDESTLNLYDCGTAEHKYTIGQNGLATVVDDDATGDGVKTFTGGYITGASGATLGGGVSNGGTFNMIGGNIIGCSADYGGGVMSKELSGLAITGGSIIGCSADYGGGVYNAVDDSILGGSITDCSANYDGGGVYNSGRSLNIIGSIADCSASGKGGGVSNSGSLDITFDSTGSDTMVGSITGCRAQYGGGVYNDGGVFNMSGKDTEKAVSITDCSAELGGGVYNGGNDNNGGKHGFFGMENGSITGCSAQAGGGVLNLYTIWMGKSSITGNSATEGGAGVLSAGEVGLSRAPVIKENKSGSENDLQDSNLVLATTEQENTANVRLMGELTNGADIGISRVKNDGSFVTAPGVFTTDSDDELKARDYIARFTSDDDTYSVLPVPNGRELMLDIHTHKFSYTQGDGDKANTITAVCEIEGCPDGFDTNAFTLTLNAAGGTYDGNPKTASISGYPDNAPDGLASKPDVKYYAIKGDGGSETDTEALAGAPVDVGTYVAQINWGGAAALKGFSISPRQVGLSWTGTSFTYDGKNHVPTAKATGLVSGDTCTVTVTGARTNAGTYTATAAELSNPNYKLPKDVTSSFTIVPKQVGLSWTGTSFTYDGKSHLPTAKATGLVSGDSCTVTVTGAGTNAGTYTAKATKLGNANYKLPGNATRTFTIANAAQKAPAAPVITDITGTSLTVKAVSGQQYSIDGGKTWKSPGKGKNTVVFTNLQTGKYYTAVTRKAAKTNYKASPASKGSKAKTLTDSLVLRSGFSAKDASIKEKKNGKYTGKVKAQITVTYGKVPGATSYEVYAQYCNNPTYPAKPPATVKNGNITSVTFGEVGGKTMKAGKSVKLYVVAKKGTKQLGSTPVVHIPVSVKTHTGVKSMTLDKSNVTLQKNKTHTVKAAITLLDSSKKLLKHVAALRFVSSDESVAVVDTNGKVTAKAPCICAILVTAENGITKKVIIQVN